MLKAINVAKRFGELKAVNDLSFEVQQGQIFGIAGPNGAGKSTVFNLITGFYKYEGKIEFDGRDIGACRPIVSPKPVSHDLFRFRKPFPASMYKKASPWAAGLVLPEDLIPPMWMRSSVLSILNRNVSKVPVF